MRDANYFSKLRSFLLQRSERHRQRAPRASVRPARTPRASPFNLEPLEPRVLLAADLAGAVQAVQIVDPVVPQQNGTATILLTNQGDARTPNNVDVTVNVYASQDQTFDSSDVQLGTGRASGRLNAGASQNVNVSLTFPSTLTPGARTLLAVVDPSNRIAENSEINNLAVGPSVNVAWQFGNVPNHAGNTNLTLRDADGTQATFSLLGTAGTGEVSVDSDGRWDVRLTGTDAQSIFNIRTSGGNQRVEIDDIRVFGPLGGIFAPTMDLVGTLAIDGPVTAGLVVGSANGAVITAPEIQGITIQGINVQGIAVVLNLNQTTIQIGDDLGDFIVGGSMTASTVQAGSIDSIRIGSLSADSRFIAPILPANAVIGGQMVATAGHPQFIVNTAPVVNDQTFSVQENSINGTGVGTIVANDLQGGALSFAVTGGTGAAAFALNSTTGQITVANSTLLDFETNPTLALNVQVTDAGNLTDTAILTINVTDVNEAPANTFGVLEHSLNGTVVGTVAPNNPQNGPLTFSFRGPGHPAFAVNSRTGQITVINSTLLDFETAPTWTFPVRVTDAANSTHEVVVTINLTDKAEQGSPPVLNYGVHNPPLSVLTFTFDVTGRPISAGQPVRIPTIVASDPDPGDNNSLTFTLGTFETEDTIFMNPFPVAEAQLVGTGNSREFSWTPRFGGQYPVQIYVTDAAGNTDFTRFLLNVSG